MQEAGSSETRSLKPAETAAAKQMLVGMITHLLMLNATFVCTSWPIAVVKWVELFVPPLLPLILQGVSNQGSAYIWRVYWDHHAMSCCCTLFSLRTTQYSFLHRMRCFVLSVLLWMPRYWKRTCDGNVQGDGPASVKDVEGNLEVGSWLTCCYGLREWKTFLLIDSSSLCFPSCSLSGPILPQRYSWWRAWRLLQ